MNKWKIMAIAIIGPLSVSGCAATLSTAHARADFLAPSLFIVEDEPRVVHYHQVHKHIHRPPVIVKTAPKPALRPVVMRPKPTKKPAPKPQIKPALKPKPLQITQKINGKKQGPFFAKKPMNQKDKGQFLNASFYKGAKGAAMKKQPKAAKVNQPKAQKTNQKNKKK
ncbi:MAG: hypothetical protein IKC13_02570 [Elusimicrobiaceae bacterium]|nr:hypothetical protein [Elusimicrobiaceae bacterium]